MTPYRFDQSQALFERAARVIPCGIYGHLSPAPLVPPSAYPFYAAEAKGSKFRDVDGNTFIDYMCAYGPMVLGYGHEAVDAAARRQYETGNCMTSPSPVMVELAEYLTDLIAVADWAFFAKNGGDVTSQAIMVARVATGRKKIVTIKGGYHGVAPWAQSPGHHGAIEEDWRHIIRIPWNDIDALEQAVAAHPNQIAAFMATPYHHPTFADSELPAPGYWKQAEVLCRKNGIVLIVDDVRCGFRLNMEGSAEFFGFRPDLACYCKAIANGYPISVLVGTEDMKNAASKVFYTGSYWFSAAPMAAAIATLEELKRIDGPRLMRETGKQLTDGMAGIAKGYGYDLKVTGIPSMPSLRITNDESLMLHQEWCAACTRRGAFFSSHHNWFLSTAHTPEDIQKTLEIADDAFAEIRRKYQDGFQEGENNADHR